MRGPNGSSSASVPPDPFAPASVDLGALTVEAPFVGQPVDAWRIGEGVRLVVVDDPGPVPYWFEPTT